MKKSVIKTFTFVIFSFFLYGCQTPQSRLPTISSERTKLEEQKQKEMVVEDYVSSQNKLFGIYTKVLASSNSFCEKNLGPYLGFKTWTNQTFDKDWRDAFAMKYGLTDKLHISYIAPGSPAEKAGLRVKDVIKSVDGWAVVNEKTSPVKLDEKVQELLKTKSNISVTIERGADTLTIPIQPIQACNFSVTLMPEDIKNAAADGKRIIFYKGMMDFAKNDDDIALILSHELAHNTMKHIDSQRKNQILGGILGVILDVAAAAGGVNTNGDFTRAGMNAGALAYSVEFEQEADYVGLYIMANAGFDINNAPNFWRRMATINSNAITIKTTHPTTPERFVGLEEAVKEINSKKEKNLPLIPETKLTSNQKPPESAEQSNSKQEVSPASRDKQKSIDSKLKELKRLRNDGLISEKVYEERQSAILQQMQ